MPPTAGIGIKVPEILLPKPGLDFNKWAVIACDQFTSEPEYWEKVASIVGDAPSTYHLILPEVYLDTPQEENRIKSNQKAMRTYLNAGMFRKVKDFIYVLRTINGRTRRGLMVCLDLEHYDFRKGAQTLIRATEGTILERLPPRIQIRKDAYLECPHILVLFDDPNDTVFGPVDEHIETCERLYDFDLMLGSGHLSGIRLNDAAVKNQILTDLEALIEPETFAEKYNLKPSSYPPLLFAMGDGNHSLATAKSIWEEIKPVVGMNHPARYALVEIENVHDPALTFKPIHRLLFHLNQDIEQAMRAHWQDQLKITELPDQASMHRIIDESNVIWHQFGLITHSGPKLIEVYNPQDNLPVGTLQKFLDNFFEQEGAEKIDYVHGTQVLEEVGQISGNAGFYVPAMDKSELFKTVILDGALPRKTFSMGEAREKRFYLECRRIQNP